MTKLHRLYPKQAHEIRFQDIIFKRAVSKDDYLVYPAKGSYGQPVFSFSGLPQYAAVILMPNGWGLQCLSICVPNKKPIEVIGRDVVIDPVEPATTGREMQLARFHLTALRLTHCAPRQLGPLRLMESFTLAHAPVLQAEIRKMTQAVRMVGPEAVEDVLRDLVAARPDGRAAPYWRKRKHPISGYPKPTCWLANYGARLQAY